MRTYLIQFGFVSLVSANIIFTHAPLHCNPTDDSRMYHGCLRGQICRVDGTCVKENGFRNGDTVSYNIPAGLETTKSKDLRCGKDFGDMRCDKYSKHGSCCSKFGYCGSTPDHCLIKNGCQSGCIDSSSPIASPILSDSFSAIISSWARKKYLGTEPSSPLNNLPPNQVETKDGTCGASNNNKICGSWPSGNCCSLYGFCGRSSAHCGAGCQSGNCDRVPLPAPGPRPAPRSPNSGIFNILGDSGVAVMHAGLLPNGKVFFLDKVENYSQIRTKDGYYAMSAEYNVVTKRPTALSYSTNAFCSGGAFLADGRVVSVGGNGPLHFINPNIGDGFKAIRTLARSSTDSRLDGQSWEEPPNRKLSTARWYPTVQIMPDGSIFVASGSLNGLAPEKPQNNNPTYEMLDRDGNPRGGSIDLDILIKNQPYHMYPFVHVLPDGNLFIFVSKQAQIYDVRTKTIIKQLANLPGDYRTYPNTGGSIMLPLSSENNWKSEIIICGGGAYQDIDSPTDASCGRITPLDANSSWEMDSMPEGRSMVEGVLLPDGTSVWLNGGNKGAQGFELSTDPVLKALLYDPIKPLGQRFSTLASSQIPRLYHSCALLLLDGTILVVGSNPFELPKLKPDIHNPYVTEYRVEQYIPPYLQGDNAQKRPKNVLISKKKFAADDRVFHVSFNIPPGTKQVKVALYHGGYVTHSLHMGHRMLFLDNSGFRVGSERQRITVHAPPNNNLAPPGPYVIYIVVDGIPSVGQFVQIS